jgi:predicted nucleic acid-binding Zn ribbon protein
MIYEPHACKAGCGATVLDDDKDTCSLPCAVELTRQRTARMRARFDRQRRTLEATIVQGNPKPLPKKPKKAAQKRARRR